MRRALLLASLLLASTTFAQDAEFARVFGGEIKGTAKQGRAVSGSLGLTRGDRWLGDRYDATLGGSLANERLWFFASATMMPAQSIDWRNIRLDAPGDARQTAAPEIPTSFLMLRSTTIFSETSTLNISVSRND